MLAAAFIAASVSDDDLALPADFRGVVGVVRGDAEPMVMAQGIAADQSLPTCSATKLLTSILVYQAVDKGRLNLTDRAARHLPADVAKALGESTIADLLYHGSTLANPDSAERPVFFTEVAQRTDPTVYFLSLVRREEGVAPGARHQYNNLDYIALGMILERVEGKAYAQLLEERLSRRLGLRHTRLQTAANIAPGEPKHYPYYAAAAVFSSAADMLKIAQALMAGKLVSRVRAEEILTQGTRFGYVGPGVFRTRIGDEPIADRPGEIWEHQVRFTLAPGKRAAAYIFSDVKGADLGRVYMRQGLSYDVTQWAIR